MTRPASPSDAAALARIFVAAWRGGYRGVVADEIIDGLDVSDWTAGFQQRLQEAAWTTVVWEDADRICGFARYGPDPDRGDDPTAGYLASLYVDPAGSGRGIGGGLLTYALADLESAGHPDVALWVFAANSRARKLYERFGFRATGEQTTDPRWRAPQVRLRRPAPVLDEDQTLR